jgi:hypothetical protein
VYYYFPKLKAGEDKTMALNKDEFLKKMKQQFDDLNYRWNLERSKLEAKSQHLSADARQKMEQEWEELGRMRQRLKEKIIDLEVAGENAWDEFKDGAEDAWEDVREGTEKAWTAFSEGLKKAVKRFK